MSMCYPGWFFKTLKTEEWKAKRLGGDVLVEPVSRVFWYHCLYGEVVKRNPGNLRENKNAWVFPCFKALFGCPCDVRFSCRACVFVNKAMDLDG